jgi:Antitoxin ParD
MMLSYNARIKEDPMSRLTIELTEQQHKSIKAMAAFQGKSIKEYTLERLLPYTDDEKAAIEELDAFLKPRLEAAQRGEVVNVSVMDIVNEVLAEPKA